MLAHALTEPDDRAPVVLYLHGLGIAGWCWEPVWSALPDLAALVPDLPGHGGSAHIAWASLEDTAARVGALVGTLPADRAVHVTGHSLGAYVAALLLAAQPDRFASAMLSGFHLGAAERPFLLKLAYAVNGLVFRVPPLLRRFATVFGDAATAERFIDGAQAIRSRTIRRAGMQVVDFQSPLAPGTLRIPTLAIAADGEPGPIRTMPATLERRFEACRGVVLEGRGHLWPLKEPALYAEMLGTHIRAQA